MDNFEDIGHLLLAKILSEEANTEEQKLFNDWLQQNPENNKEYERIKSLWESAQSKHKYDLTTAHSRIQQKIAAQTQSRHNLYRTLRKVAAIFVLPILFASLYWGVDLFRNEINQQTAINTISCPLGETMTVDLPDGSFVFLNAGSQISYPLSFDNLDTREVTLDGEALFEVAKDKDHPFIVDLGKIDIRVLGTIFNVSNYSEDSKTEIFLKEGSIELISFDNHDSPSNKLKMSPSQLARIATNGQLLELIKADADSYGGWRNGVLTFNDDSMEDVIRKLIRKYDVLIDFSEAKNIDSKINGSFKDKTIEEILDILKYTTSISYQVKNTNAKAKKHIIIKSN
ncbi:FecR family protein [Sunxiuqinia sp. sy24]|uniref:FecR family protein n=1 Tax=Sunxiuqinia sp. sy24 TaxID=3461495 RepID=UPI004046061D